MLTEEQIRQFRVFGFIVLRQAFDTQEIESLTNYMTKACEAKLGHTPTDGEHISIAPFLELDPATTPLIEDDRLYYPIVQLLGDDMIWMGSEGVHGTMTGKPSHHWHADRPGKSELDYLRIKIMMYLNPMRKDFGAFRVIPGSHRSPFHEELMPFQERHSSQDSVFFGDPGNEVPCHAVETDPGDVVFFNQSLFHAVYGKTQQRRYVALKYAARPNLDDHFISIKRFSPDALEPHEQLLNSENPRLRRMMAGFDDITKRVNAL